MRADVSHTNAVNIRPSSLLLPLSGVWTIDVTSVR